MTEPFHIVLTTHNSRYSQRMIAYHVIKGPPLLLSLEHEILLTYIMGQIISENDFKVLAFNVCKDHVHMVLWCSKDELANIIQKLKSISSKLFRRALGVGIRPIGEGVSPNDPLSHKCLWSQKFFRVKMFEDKFLTLSNRPGLSFTNSYLENTLAYIKSNRVKHQLEHSEVLNQLIEKFISQIDLL